MKQSNSTYMRGLTALAVTLLTVLTVSFSSCNNDILYSRFVPISSEKWHMDSVIHFDIPLSDTLTLQRLTTNDQRLIIYIRHTERYPYQNMWLFVGDSLHRDTIEFYLADDRGQWLGERHHGFIEMPVLYEEHKSFTPACAHYYIEIQHAMRDTLLRGITDIGLEIKKQ